MILSRRSLHPLPVALPLILTLLTAREAVPFAGRTREASAASLQAQNPPQTPQEKARLEKEERARQHELEFARDMAIGTGFEPNIGKVARLASLGPEGMEQVATTPVLVGLERTPILTLRRYNELLHIKRSLGPGFRWDEGYKAADLEAALATTKTLLDKHIASGELFPLPFGTLVRVLEFRPPVYVPPPPGGSPLGAGGQAFEQLMRNIGDIHGTYRVEVLDEVGKGKQVWTDAARINLPLRGDTVHLYLPKYPTLPVPLGTLQTGLPTIDMQNAKETIPLLGRATEPKARARFDNLVRAKRLVLLPPGTACVVISDSPDGKLFLVSPLSGAQRNNGFLVRKEHITLRMPKGTAVNGAADKANSQP